MTIIQGATNATTTVDVGPIPFAVEVNPATKKAYVLSYGNDTMTVIDETTDSVSKTVSLGTHPQALAIDEQSDQIYVANQRTASVTVIDGKTNLPVVKVDVGTIPYAFGIDPAAHMVYVANFSSNNVTVIVCGQEVWLRDDRIKELVFEVAHVSRGCDRSHHGACSGYSQSPGQVSRGGDRRIGEYSAQ